MTDDEPATADEAAAKLSDPVPSTGEHPGGPRRDEGPFPAVAAGVREYLSAGKLGANREVVGCAALTHDLHRALGDGDGCPPDDTLPEVARVLEAAGADIPVPAVQHCVAVHEDLDAMGAVGVARTFAFGGARGTPLWDPDGEEYSQLYHFEDKLLRLTGELHTEPARELAAERHAFLEIAHDLRRDGAR